MQLCRDYNDSDAFNDALSAEWVKMRFITFMPIVRREGDSIMIFLHTSDRPLGAAAGEKD